MINTIVIGSIGTRIDVECNGGLLGNDIAS